MPGIRPTCRVGVCLMQSVQNFAFIRRLRISPGQHVSSRRIHGLQSERIGTARVGDRAGEHGLDTDSLADFAPGLNTDAIVR